MASKGRIAVAMPGGVDPSATARPPTGQGEDVGGPRMDSGADDAARAPPRPLAIGPASAALGLLPPNQCKGTDQRGISRRDGLGGKRCDAGAYELAQCAGKIIGKGAIIGTGKRDVLRGTKGADVIVGQG